MALTLNTPARLPSSKDSKLAQASINLLAKYGKKNIKVKLEGQDESLVLPASVVELLEQALGEVAKGNVVTLVSLEAELSTYQAAEVLKVSRPYLIKLLEGGKIPYHMVGTHRRIKLQDVLRYKKASDVESHKALKALAKQAQELNMGY